MAPNTGESIDIDPAIKPARLLPAEPKIPAAKNIANAVDVIKPTIKLKLYTAL